MNAAVLFISFIGAMVTTGAAVRTVEDPPFVIEKISSGESLRLNVRGTAVPAAGVFLAIAEAAAIQVPAMPPDFEGTIETFILRSARPSEALEAVAGFAGFRMLEKGASVTLERLPETPAGETFHPSEERPAIRNDAIAGFQHFLAIGASDPRAKQAWFELAWLHEEAGNTAQALETMRAFHETATQIDSLLEAQVAVGRYELELGRYEEATLVLAEIADKYATKKPAAEACMLLGRARLLRGEPAVAKRYFEICIERYADADATTRARIWNIEALKQLGEIELAWKELETVEDAALYPSLALELLEVRTVLAETSGEYTDALEGWIALAGAARIQSRRDALLKNAANCAKRSGDSLAELFTRCSISGADRTTELGVWLMTQGFAEIAMRRLQGNPEAHMRSIYELIQRNDLEGARRLLRKAPQDGVWENIRRLVEAGMYLKTKEYRKIPPILSEAIKKSMDRAFVQAAFRCLGDAYLAVNELENAGKAYSGFVPEVRQ